MAKEETFNMTIGQEGSGTLRGKFPASMVEFLGGNKGDVISLTLQKNGRNVSPVSIKVLTGRNADAVRKARPNNFGNGSGTAKAQVKKVVKKTVAKAETPVKSTSGTKKVVKKSVTPAKTTTSRKTKVEYEQPRKVAKATKKVVKRHK